MADHFRMESRIETIARFRKQLVEDYSNKAFNFEEALAEFDKNPEEFNMEFYTVADVAIAKLKEHPDVEYFRDFWEQRIHRECGGFGWFCKPGHYPSIKF